MSKEKSDYFFMRTQMNDKRLEEDDMGKIIMQRLGMIQTDGEFKMTYKQKSN